ncbi:MAG: hypothetical protein EZS28_047132, partial [Streblomastix strix]
QHLNGPRQGASARGQCIIPWLCYSLLPRRTCLGTPSQETPVSAHPKEKATIKKEMTERNVSN